MKLQTAIGPDGAEVVLIHFLYSSPVGMIEGAGLPLAQRGNSWKIACMPNLFEFSTQSSHRPIPHMRSDDPRAVTCSVCKETEHYKRAAASLFGGTR